MSFSWFELLLLIGITLGLITSVLLLCSGNNTVSNRYLALTLIAFCLISIKMICNTLGLTNSNYLFHYLPLATELAIAPLIYLYSVSLITQKISFRQLNLFILYPSHFSALGLIHLRKFVQP